MRKMSKYKIYTQKPSKVTFDMADGKFDLEMEALSAIDAEIIEVDAKSEDEFIDAVRDADAIIARGRKITRKIIENLESCKVISMGGVGTDTIDVHAATEHNIPVTNVPDTFIEEVADHAMMLILASFRRLLVQDRMSRDGRLEEGRPALSTLPRLYGLTLGFISFGHVARLTAQRAAPFGVRMLAYDPYIEELKMSEYGVEPVSLNDLLKRSDIVSMHAPSTTEAQQMMSTEQFKLMKNDALFINTGRGTTVDEQALIKALQNNWIAGAVLDVLETEPPSPDNPLLKMDNVIITTHVASASLRMGPETRRRVGQELTLVLSGKWPRTCVNPHVLPNTKLIRWQPFSMERGPGAG